MKKYSILNVVAAMGMVAFVSCNDTSKTANSTDTTGTATVNPTDNTANSTTSSGDYSAYADEIEKNSTSGRYMNPKTGKKYSKLTVNRNTGEITDENNEPVWRYVDTDNWWVYGLNDSDWTWEHMGDAKMNNNNLMYQDENGKWVNYDTRWKTSDENLSKTWKTKVGDTKIKFGKDGDIKVKDENGKTKYDADDNRIKTDSSH
jgi:hypothetical protein